MVALVRNTRTTELVMQVDPAEVKLTRITLLTLRSVEDGPPEPPDPPPVDPPDPVPPPEQAPRLRWNDVTRVLNEFGEDMQEVLAQYVDSNTSGAVARSGVIDMSHQKITSSGAPTAPFDLIRLQDIPS